MSEDGDVTVSWVSVMCLFTRPVTDREPVSNDWGRDLLDFRV